MLLGWDSAGPGAQQGWGCLAPDTGCISGILYGTMTMELGGKVSIECAKNNFQAELEFKLKVALAAAWGRRGQGKNEALAIPLTPSPGPKEGSPRQCTCREQLLTSQNTDRAQRGEAAACSHTAEPAQALSLWQGPCILEQRREGPQGLVG